EYVRYTMNTNLHPRVWPANAASLYQWWLERSNAQISPSFLINGLQSVATIAITGSVDPNCAVEYVVPGSGSAFQLQVFTNTVLASGGAYRLRGQTIKILAATSVTNAQIRYFLGPRAVNDTYRAVAGATLNISAPGVLANDGPGMAGGLTTALISGAANGALVLGTNGAFSYAP